MNFVAPGRKCGASGILMMKEVGTVTHAATSELDAEKPGGPLQLLDLWGGAQLIYAQSRKRPRMLSGYHEDSGAWSPQGLCTCIPSAWGPFVSLSTLPLANPAYPWGVNIDLT